MKKLFFAIALALLIPAAYIPASAENEEKTVDIDGAQYRYIVENDGVEIVNIETEGSKLVIPETIDGMSVTRIGQQACDELEIKNVELPGTIKILGEMAFESCEDLSGVEIPDSVIEMGEACFGYCASLRSVRLSANCKSIGTACFSNCSSLEKIEIPDGVTKIEKSAFVNCSSLQSAVIPDTVTEIGGGAFRYDARLSDVNWSRNIDKIGSGVFDGTKWLSNQPDGYLLLNGGALLYRYGGSAKEATIPDGVKEISSEAFEETVIESITIPAYIDAVPYSLCHKCTGLKSVRIEDGVTGIAKNAFAGCTALKNITLPQSLTYISATAFMECKALEEASIPESVTTIGERCFYECESLVSVRLPSGLKKLGGRVFVGCQSLKRINIPAGIIEAFDPETFTAVNNLADVTVEGAVTKKLAEALHRAGWNGATEWNIIDGVLVSYNGSGDAVIPDGVTEIGERAFAGSEITSVYIPEGVTKIGLGAFYKQEGLTSVTIPSSVRTIDQMAFSDCTALGEVIFEYSNDTLALGAASFQFVPVMPDTVKTNGRNILNIAAAFKNTTLDPEADEYISQPEKSDMKGSSGATSKTESVASEAAQDINVRGGETITVSLGDKEITFMDAKPYIDENGRTKMPIRAVAEALGCEVDWDDATRTAVIKRGNDVVYITIGKDTLQVGNKTVQMDTVAEIKDERTYIPVRFVGEALGMTVNWIG